MLDDFVVVTHDLGWIQNICLLQFNSYITPLQHYLGIYIYTYTTDYNKWIALNVYIWYRKENQILIHLFCICASSYLHEWSGYSEMCTLDWSSLSGIFHLKMLKYWFRSLVYIRAYPNIEISHGPISFNSHCYYI